MSSPVSRKISTVRVCACFTVLPASLAYCLRASVDIISGASATNRPSRPIIGRVAKFSSRHQITSVKSPNVQTMAMPEPLSGWASGWACTGTETLKIGVCATLPNKCWYRASSGWATRPTHAAINSGRVVSTVNSLRVSSGT